MICTPCARAADQRAGRAAHCTDPGCTCGHRVERYAVPPLPVIRVLADGEDSDDGPFAIPPHVLGIYQAHADDTQAHAAAVEAAIAGQTTEARLRPPRERPKLSGSPDAPPCTATIKGPGWVNYCQLAAGHYDESDLPDFSANPPHPGGWHDDTLGGVWSDLAEGATPHTDTATEH